MNRVFAIFLFVVLPSTADDFAGVEQDAKNWYQTSYAPIWKAADEIDLDKLRSQYANGYRVHSTEGGFSIAENSNEEWLGTLASFGGSWVGSDLQHFTVTALNANSVAIRSEWVNRNGDGTTSSNCANYVAERTKEFGWQFLDLFVVACPR